MSPNTLLEVGQVTHTAVYPIKGMRQVSLPQLTLKSISVLGDRVRAFASIDTKETPSFIDTIKFPGLLQYQPYFTSPEDPKNSEIVVKTPEGKEYLADSPELLQEISQKSGRNLTIVRMGRGAYHSMPVSLLSLASIIAIEQRTGIAIDPTRFRMNLLIQTTSQKEFEEDTWINKQLIFGEREDSAIIAVVKPDTRCATIDMDPHTGTLTLGILKSVVTDHNKTLGVYCTIVKEGTIRNGDKIYLH